MQPGHDFIGVGVGAVVFNREGLVFFAKRGGAATNEKGHWELPGGRVEFGERLYCAIKREFIEEYGMGIEIADLLGAFDHILKEERQHWVSITYVARHIGGIPQILEPAKCTAIGWFSLLAPPAPLSQITLANIEQYNSKYRREIDWYDWKLAPLGLL